MIAPSSLGIYLSIPFCRSKCTYCNFASGVYPASEHGRYVDRLIGELRGAAQDAARDGVVLPQSVDTIYLGGGTPSLLEPALLVRLFATLRSEFALRDDAEITMECAPGQIADATLDAMVAVGVNRVSLGVQSFIDCEARSCGRLHTRAIVLEDLKRLAGAGIHNVNVDLIAGLAGQTFDSWNESVGVLIETGVRHASVYMLEVDEDSRLGREVLAGGVRYQAELVPNDDSIARMYQHAVDVLEAAGRMQYEISNFALPGDESRHNLRYWQRKPYLGLGLDASSMLYASEPGQRTGVLRWTTTSDLGAFLAGAERAETCAIGDAQQLEEAWFLGLRMNAGVQLEALKQEFGEPGTDASMEIAARLAAEGLLRFRDGWVQLTPRGRMLSNDVFQEFIAMESPAERTNQSA